MQHACNLSAGMRIVCVAFVVGGFSGSVSHAADAPNERKIDAPLAVVCVASVQRLLSDVDYTFQSADHPEHAAVIHGLLALSGDLKGMDRTKPFGVIISLNPGVVPEPVAIGFVPVEYVDDLMKTVSLLHMKRNQLPGKPNRYELVVRGQTLQLLLRDGYAFVARKAVSLNRRFSDPVKLTRELSRRYDIAVAVHFRNVPKGMKNVVLDYLRASQADLQQGDEESDDAFRLRKSGSRTLLTLIEALLTEGDELTVGWNLSDEQKTAVLELTIAATPDSRFSRYLKGIGGKRSRLANLLTESEKWHLHAKLAHQAFAKGGDTVRIDFGPHPHGARLRVQFDEGFIRYLGLLAADGINQRQR